MVIEQIATVQTVYSVDWHKLAALLGKFYKLTSSLEFESRNDTDYKEDVTDVNNNDDRVEEGRDLIRSGWFEDWQLNQVLSAAVADGAIPPAIYAVRVSW